MNPNYWPQTPSFFGGTVVTTPGLTVPQVPQGPKTPVFAPRGYASLSVPQTLSKQLRLAGMEKNINQTFKNPGIK